MITSKIYKKRLSQNTNAIQNATTQKANPLASISLIMKKNCK